MTPERACAALERRIIALFAAEEDGEAQAYTIQPNQTGAAFHYVYHTFANGEEKPEGVAPRVCDSLEQAVDRTVAAVAQVFPDHASQKLIWRCRPAYEEWPAFDGVVMIMGEPKQAADPCPAGWMLRCRLVGVPNV